jgi:hypothetical protein
MSEQGILAEALPTVAGGLRQRPAESVMTPADGPRHAPPVHPSARVRGLNLRRGATSNAAMWLREFCGSSECLVMLGSDLRYICNGRPANLELLLSNTCELTASRCDALPSFRSNFEPGGRGFESLRPRQIKQALATSLLAS